MLCTTVGAWAGLQAMDQRDSRDHPWQWLRCGDLPPDHAKSRGSVELPRRAVIDGWQRVDSLDRQTDSVQSIVCEMLLYIMSMYTQYHKHAHIL